MRKKLTWEDLVARLEDLKSRDLSYNPGKPSVGGVNLVRGPIKSMEIDGDRITIRLTFAAYTKCFAGNIKNTAWTKHGSNKPIIISRERIEEIWVSDYTGAIELAFRWDGKRMGRWHTANFSGEQEERLQPADMKTRTSRR